MQESPAAWLSVIRAPHASWATPHGRTSRFPLTAGPRVVGSVNRRDAAHHLSDDHHVRHGVRQQRRLLIRHTNVSACTHGHYRRPTHTRTRTHARTHTFNGPLSRTTRVSRYQKGKTNLDFTEARDSEWQWHQLGHTQVCTSLQADNHASTPPLSVHRPDALPAAQPTASKH